MVDVNEELHVHGVHGLWTVEGDDHDLGLQFVREAGVGGLEFRVGLAGYAEAFHVYNYLGAPIK
jgi:hypothetical protein